MILVHRCFNQQAGETKSEHCFCERIKEQISRRQADQYVREGKADWLKGWNGKAKKFVEYRVAIVSRWEDIPLDDGSGNVRQQACSVPYGPAYIEAVVGPASDVPSLATANADDYAAARATKKEQRRQQRRLIRHEKIKLKIKARARKTLRKFSCEDFTDADLDAFFQHPEDFYRRLPGTVAGYTKMFQPVLTHYWNNILGRDDLSTEAGLMMKQADRGTGLLIYHPPGKLELMSGMRQADELHRELYGGKRVHCPQKDEDNEDDNEYESDGQDELTLAYDAVSEFDDRHKTFQPTSAEIEEWNCAVLRDARRRERRNPNKTFRRNDIDAVPYR